MVDKNGNIHGTGFFIDADGDVVTAAHVVIGFAGAKAQMFVHQRGTHDDHAVSIIAIDNGLDIAILRTGIKTKNFFKLVESDSLQPGDKLYVVGHPYGVPWQMLEGLFSAHGVFDGHYILWVSVWIERGCSGGPILNSKGEVVGLVDAFYNPMAPVAGHTNICIPGTDILRLLLAARES
jgi:serine protease Do